MYTVDAQVHGYRRGHQLIASSLTLPKDEQSVIDRLSDVAGPLRPNERFAPYLSGYPLPDGQRYVLARTWQDLTVARAGCVRTLSLLIPIAEWSEARTLDGILELLDPYHLPDESVAVRRGVHPAPKGKARLAVPKYQGAELLEALFLEEPKPVAVFEAPTPELIAVRLVTALWDELRQRFAFSTFARSPRRIEGRFFDLVFAPIDARSKFSNWPGRRVDARSEKLARHAWTKRIAERVFAAKQPRFLDDNEIALIGKDTAGTTAALRIAFLWDDLITKVESTPTAALGLLDIAKSRPSWNSAAFADLDPAIAVATKTAGKTLPADEAFDFIGALVRKLQGRDLREARIAARAVTRDLSSKDPEGAIGLLERLPSEALVQLASSVGDGISTIASEQTMATIIEAHPSIVGRLICESKAFANRLARDETLADVIGRALKTLDEEVLVDLCWCLLPLLFEDWQLAAAEPLLDMLDADALAVEVRHLAEANGFAASSFHRAVSDRAKARGGIRALRETLLYYQSSPDRDAFLATTLSPSRDDAAWLINATGLGEETRKKFLATLLRTATSAEFAEVTGEARVRDGIINALGKSAPDVLQRIFAESDLPIEEFVSVALDLLPALDQRGASDVAWRALKRCFQSSFGGDETTVIARFLDATDEAIDVALISDRAFEHNVVASLVNRNLRAFGRVAPTMRRRFAERVDNILGAIAGRRPLDLDASGSEAAASLIRDAAEIAPSAALNAAGLILPRLMYAQREPISHLLAVAFPLVYRELAKASEAPEFLKFVPFYDWDRCKTARRELVAAFLSSSWPPVDIALIACRCHDVDKILQRIALSWGARNTSTASRKIWLGSRISVALL